MKERNKESLSALLDGEADELEVRRILNQLDNDDELRDKWKNYHLMGSLMRDEKFDHIDLTQGINQALDGVAGSSSNDSNVLEETTNVGAAKPAWYKPLTSVAVAASVTLAVLLGVQSIGPNEGIGLASTDNQPSAELTASTLSTEDQQQLEAAQQQLQEYVLQNPAPSAEGNDKDALPFARVVEFETQNK
jgi:sigma-E factor negative regulatory protein RseA